MTNLLDTLLIFIINKLPQDYLLPTRFFIAQAILYSFFIGFFFAYIFNFLAKKAFKSFRTWWKEKRRDRRLNSIKIPNGELVGEVTQFLSKLKVAIIEVKKQDLRVGDTILIKGANTKLMLPVKSMQVNRKEVNHVRKGVEFGLLTGKPVYRNDLVFKIQK